MQTPRFILTGLALVSASATLMILNWGCAQTLCERRYTIRGTVTDNVAAALDGVTVKMGGQTVATTDATGAYSVTTVSVRSSYAGRTLTFEKSGYVTGTATAFTSDEAGDAVCGTGTLTRNAELTPG